MLPAANQASAIATEMNGIPENYQIQLVDQNTNEKFIYDRLLKEIKPFDENDDTRNKNHHRTASN